MNPRVPSKLAHLPELTIDGSLFDLKFRPDCNSSQCSGKCCEGGVYADLAEKRLILDHADLVRSHMDPGQVSDESKWFEGENREDRDYPSGRVDGTEVHNGACVFLNSRRLCVLEIASRRENLPFPLRPFFCRLFPLTIEAGTLSFEDASIADRPECCGAGGGLRNAVEAFPYEMGLVLEQSEIDRLNSSRTSPTSRRR